MRQALIIFVRQPVYGKVKTRLAKGIGNAKALEVYELLLGHTKAVAVDVQADKLVFYADDIPQTDQWCEAGFCRYRQSTGDLGERMQQAFTQAFASGYEKVVIIGSDCYQLTPALVSNAFARLADHDVVLGPTFDGGYYLLGLTRPLPDLFSYKTWSSDTVYADTLRDAQKLHRTVYSLLKLHDVDEAADLLHSGIEI